MVIGILDGKLSGGALVLPSRSLYEYLTDRVGNYRELEPYFPVWKKVRIDNGVVLVYEIEHESLSKKVRTIPKGEDGNAFRALITERASKGTKRPKRNPI